MTSPRKSKDQTLPLGSRESFTWFTLKTILCLVLDFQGFMFDVLVFLTRQALNRLQSLANVHCKYCNQNGFNPFEHERCILKPPPPRHSDPGVADCRVSTCISNNSSDPFNLIHPRSLTWPLKDHGWNTRFLWGWYIFRGYVKLPGSKSCWFQRKLSFLEGITQSLIPLPRLDRSSSSSSSSSVSVHPSEMCFSESHYCSLATCFCRFRFETTKNSHSAMFGPAKLKSQVNFMFV